MTGVATSPVAAAARATAALPGSLDVLGVAA